VKRIGGEVIIDRDIPIAQIQQ